jgi:multidrug efflux system membrane fusion protein
MSDPESTAVLKRAKLMVGGIVCLLLISGVIVLVLRSFQASALNASTVLHAKQYVKTIIPKPAADGQPLTLPGTLLGVIESSVYARSNGYVTRWIKDIGSSVKRGELLAEIAAPEPARAWPKAPLIAGRPCVRRTPSLSRTWMSV